MTSGGALHSIQPIDFKLDNTILISNEVDYDHSLKYKLDTSIKVIDVSITLVVSSTSFKYPVEVTSFKQDQVSFKTSPTKHELSEFDEIEVLFILNDNTSIRVKKNITRKVVNSANLVGTFNSNAYYKFNESNLLLPRLRLGFPKWGTIENNILSNGSKLLEPLFSPLYASFYKLITLKLKALYDKPYSNIISIPTISRPLSVYKFLGGNPVAMHETLDRELSPVVAHYTKQELQTTNDLSFLLVDSTTSLSQSFTEFYNTRLYFKSTSGDGWVRISGTNTKGDFIEETVTTLLDFFRPFTNKFTYINKVECSGIGYLSNYINTGEDHYIVKDIRTYPPMVNKDLNYFHPKVRIDYAGTPNSLGLPTLQIYDVGKDYGLTTPDISFVASLQGGITSLYIDEYLKCTFMDRSGMVSTTNLSYNLNQFGSKLHPSNLNNDVVTIDYNSEGIPVCIINTENLPEKEPYIVQILQDNYTDKSVESVYVNTDTLELSPSIVYNQPSSEDIIKIELGTELTPYIINVFTHDFSKQYQASVSYNLLEASSVMEYPGYTGFVIYDDKLRLYETLPSNKVTEESNSELMSIIIDFDTSCPYTWRVDFGGYFLSNSGDQMPENSSTVVVRGGLNKERTLININTEVLKSLGCNSPIIKLDILDHYEHPQTTGAIIIRKGGKEVIKKFEYSTEYKIKYEVSSEDF